jgi:outer membrane protein assembly factor BamB
MTAKGTTILAFLGTLLLHGCTGKLLLTRALEAKPGDWPVFGRTEQQTHAAPEILRPPLELRWDYDLGAGTASGTPLLIDGVVFAGNLRGELHALDLQSGKRLGWTRLGDAVHGSPAVRNRILLVPLSNTEESLVAFDLSTGIAVWRKEMGEIEVSLVPSGGSVFFGNLAGEFFCVSADDGSLRWKFSLPENTSLKGIRSTPAVRDGRVLFGADDGAVYALDAATGRLLWRQPLGSAIFAPVTTDSARAFAATLEGTVAALELASGRVAWRSSAGGPVHGHILPIGEFAIAATAAGEILAFGRADGTAGWRQTAGGPLSAGLISAGEYLYVGTLKRELLALEASTGVLLWKTELEGRVKTAPVTADGTLIVVTDDKTLLAFGRAGP